MKSIIFQLNLKGEGVVNFDDSSQRWLYTGADNKLKHLFHPHDNVKYAKKVLYKDSNGNLSNYKLKISSKCLRKGIFENDLVGQNTNFIMNKEILYSQLGSPYYMINGYTLTVRDSTSYKKKSPVTIGDAIQTSENLSIIETFTRSGAKKVKVDSSDKSDTSLYNEETVGDMTYSAKGTINLNELQFVSLDDYYDRWSFSPDEFEIFSKYMKINMPSFDSKVGYYKMNNSCNSFPELGFKFSNEDIDFLTKLVIKKLMNVNILRNGSYAQFDSLKIKFVDNIFSDKFSSEDNWIEIKTMTDVDNLTITPDEFYILEDTNTAEEFRKQLVPQIEEKKEKTDKKATKEKSKNLEILNNE